MILSPRFFSKSFFLAFFVSSSAFADLNSHFIKKLENLVESKSRQSKVPGFVFGAVLNGKIAFAKTHGIRRAAYPERIDADTIFQIGSVSKTLTAALVIKSHLSGHLSLQQPIAQYLPEWCPNRLCDGIKIEDLLSHSSGIPSLGLNASIEANEPYSNIVKKAFEAKRKCPPGQCFDYNNVSFAMLKDILEKANGNTFSKLMQVELLTPLKMNHTSSTYAELVQSKNVFAPHLFQKSKYTETPFSLPYYAFPASCSFHSNLNDMLQFLLAELGAYPEVLSQQALELLHRPRIKAPVFKKWSTGRFESSQYALGHRIFRVDGIDIVAHMGWLKGTKNLLVMIPSQKFGFIFLQNTASDLHMKLLFDIVRLVKESIPQPSKDAPSKTLAS